MERIIEIVDHGGPDGWHSYSYGEAREKVVRCRDCEYARHYRPYVGNGKRSTIEKWYCYWHSNLEGASEIEPDGFCAWAERRA